MAAARRLRLLALALVVAGSCSSDPAPVTSDAGAAGSSTVTAEATTTTAVSGTDERCPSPTIEQVGTVADPLLDEISGAAASPTRPGRIWVHEDSGNDPVLTLLDLDGSTSGSWIVEAVDAVDWEDVAAVAAPPTLFVADIGDNQATRDDLAVIRLAEPSDTAPSGVATPDAILHLVLPEPANAEALLVDPRTGDLVIVTKELGGEADVLVAPGAAWDDGDEPVAVRRAGVLDLGPLSPVLAGDVSGDGAAVVLRTPSSVLWWPRLDDESIADALFGDEPCRLPSSFDLYGEAIALLPDGGYVLVGEGSNPAIHRAR